ncbi:hypothetical protein AKJ16_DCAP25527 [Drosera capensis]
MRGKKGIAKPLTCQRRVALSLL